MGVSAIERLILSGHEVFLLQDVESLGSGESLGYDAVPRAGDGSGRGGGRSCYAGYGGGDGGIRGVNLDGAGDGYGDGAGRGTRVGDGTGIGIGDEKDEYGFRRPG